MTFVQQRQSEPERHRGGREGDTDRGISARRERPIERRAQVVDVASIDGQPVGGGPRLPFRLGALEQIPVILGMAPREPLELAALDEFLACVRARRLEEPIGHDRPADVRRHQRLGDQVRHALDDVRGGDLEARSDRGGRVEREAPGEDRQAPQDHPLGRGEQVVAPVQRRP